jgi:hypothetical protein
MAEGSTEEYVGLYDGHQTEIGAQLQLDGDGRFQYYMSYGAVDEMASGAWTAGPDGVFLDSDSVLAPAFELVDSKQGSGSAFDLTLDVPDRMPIEFFSAVVLFSDGTASHEDFHEPKLHLKLPRGKSLTAVALLFPIYEVSSDKIDVPANTGAMHFKFSPNDLGTVAFAHQLLRQDGGGLLLERYDRTLRFSKQTPPEDPIDQVAGTWGFTREDCEPDSQFAPRADLPGTSIVLAPDHGYRISGPGKEASGTFKVTATDEGYVLVELVEAKENFLLNGDELDSWSDEPVATECTHVFGRQE